MNELQKKTVQFEMQVDDIPFATDGLSQPALYADFIKGALVSGGVVKLNFVESRADALINDLRLVHVASIVTPLSQIRGWALYLTQLADMHGAPPLPERQEEPASGSNADV